MSREKLEHEKLRLEMEEQKKKKQTEMERERLEHEKLKLEADDRIEIEKRRSTVSVKNERT